MTADEIKAIQTLTEKYPNLPLDYFEAMTKLLFSADLLAVKYQFTMKDFTKVLGELPSVHS